MIKFTKKIDYSFILLGVLGKIYLKDLNDNVIKNQTRLVMKSFCEENHISLKFVQAIVTQLVRKGIVGSKVGMKGGVYLCKDPKEISLLEIIESIESPIALMDCLKDSTACIRTSFCPITHVLTEVQEVLRNKLKQMTVLDIIVGEEQVQIHCPVLEENC